MPSREASLNNLQKAREASTKYAKQRKLEKLKKLELELNEDKPKQEKPQQDEIQSESESSEEEIVITKRGRGRPRKSEPKQKSRTRTPPPPRDYGEDIDELRALIKALKEQQDAKMSKPAPEAPKEKTASHDYSHLKKKILINF